MTLSYKIPSTELNTIGKNKENITARKLLREFWNVFTRNENFIEHRVTFIGFEENKIDDFIYYIPVFQNY